MLAVVRAICTVFFFRCPDSFVKKRKMLFPRGQHYILAQRMEVERALVALPDFKSGAPG